jgi:DNA replication protein DnaC
MTAARKPTVDVDHTRVLLQRLGLGTAAERIEDLLTVAVKEEDPAHRFLDRVLDTEVGNSEERRIRTSLKLSSLPQGQTLANFDFALRRRFRSRSR